MDQSTADLELKEIMQWSTLGYPGATDEFETLDRMFWLLNALGSLAEKVFRMNTSPNRTYTDRDIERFLNTKDVRAIPYFLDGCQTRDEAAAFRFKSAVSRLLSTLEPSMDMFRVATRLVMYRLLTTSRLPADEGLMLWIIGACRASNDILAIEYLTDLRRKRTALPSDERVKAAAKECREYLIALRDKNESNSRLLRVVDVDDDNLLRAAGHQGTTPELLLRSTDSEVDTTGCDKFVSRGDS